MISLAFRSLQFLVYHLLIIVVDRISRLPRSGVQPEVERILRENLALKAQVRTLVLELKSERGARPKVSLRTRVAQVFADLLTRGDSAFQNYYLSASSTTIERWATKLRRGPWPWRNRDKGGRPPLAQEIKDLIIELKEANALWGSRRIKDELAHIGIKVSEPTIQKVLKEAGFNPRGGHPLNLDPQIDDSRLAEIFTREVLAMLVRKELLSPEWAERILSWPHSGFNVHSLVPGQGEAGGRGERGILLSIW